MRGLEGDDVVRRGGSGSKKLKIIIITKINSKQNKTLQIKTKQFKSIQMKSKQFKSEQIIKLQFKEE